MKKTQDTPYRIILGEEELPKNYYNVRGDMKKKPAPLLNPKTKKPISAKLLAQDGLQGLRRPLELGHERRRLRTGHVHLPVAIEADLLHLGLNLLNP